MKIVSQNKISRIGWWNQIGQQVTGEMKSKKEKTYQLIRIKLRDIENKKMSTSFMQEL